MLRDRLLSGILIGFFGLLPFILPGTAGALLFVVMATVGVVFIMSELFSLCRHMALPTDSGPGTAGAGIWMAFTGFLLLQSTGQHWLVEPAWVAFPTLLVLVLVIRNGREMDRKTAVTGILVTFASVCLVMFSLGVMIRVYFWSDPDLPVSGRIAALYLVLVTKMSDIGGYAVGTLTAKRNRGNHKLLPALSPGKSWEGLAGGLAAGVAAALAFSWPRQALFGNFAPPGEMMAAASFGLACALLGLGGDILASILKRAAAVKDSGWIPGLGGIIDMLDSLILVTPLFYVYLRVRSGG